MKRELKVYKCEICGKMVSVLQDGGGALSCCNTKMREQVPNTSDGAGEKHVPVLSYENSILTVKVGEVEHPATEEHGIEWIYVVYDGMTQARWLDRMEKPMASFKIEHAKNIKVYEYCNLHGLWIAELNVE